MKIKKWYEILFEAILDDLSDYLWVYMGLAYVYFEQREMFLYVAFICIGFMNAIRQSELRCRRRCLK